MNKKNQKKKYIHISNAFVSINSLNCFHYNHILILNKLLNCPSLFNNGYLNQMTV